MAMVSERLQKLGSSRSVIRELFEYGKVRAAEIGAENVFDFSLGNPSVPAPKEVNETAIRILQENPELIHCYTSGQGDLVVRERLAASMNRRFGTSYSPAELYMTCGAASSLCCTIRALTLPEEENEVVVFAPFFPEYRVFVESSGSKMVVIPPREPDFQLPLDLFEAALTPATRAVMINSPSNPSGVVYTRETLVELANILTAKAEEFGHPIYLISDEPYREIVFDGVEVPWVPDLYKDTIVCYSYSKSLSLPGERIGYVLVPNQTTDARDVFAAIMGAGRSMGYVNAPSLFQNVISLCADMTSDLAVYERNCKLLVPALRSMGYELPEPGGAFYLFPKSLEPDDRAFSERAKEFDLLLAPGFGFGAPGHFRLSYCVPTERIERALPRFKALAEAYGK